MLEVTSDMLVSYMFCLRNSCCPNHDAPKPYPPIPPLQATIPPKAATPWSCPKTRWPNHNRPSITLQHAIHQVSQRAPEVLAARQAMLIDEQHVVLEACVQMGFQTQLDDDRVVVTVDVGVDTVEALEDLADEGGECFRKWDTWG